MSEPGNRAGVGVVRTWTAVTLVVLLVLIAGAAAVQLVLAGR